MLYFVMQKIYLLQEGAVLMRFLCGLIGAIIFAFIAWAAIGVIGMTGWFTYIAAGIVAYAGFSIAQWIHDKVMGK